MLHMEPQRLNSRRREKRRIEGTVRDAAAGIVGSQQMKMYSSLSQPRPMTTNYLGTSVSSSSLSAPSLYRKSLVSGGPFPELSSSPDLSDRSWMRGRALGSARIQKNQRFQSLGVEFEVIMNETLPLCVPRQGDRRPNSQRTAACLRMLDAFSVILGSEDTPLRTQFSLVTNELRRALYSPEMTVADVERFSQEGVPQAGQLDKIPYHELCHDLQRQREELEDTIETQKIELKNQNHQLSEVRAALKGQKAVVEQLSYMRSVGINRKNLQKKQIEALEKETSNWEKEYAKLEGKNHDIMESRDQWRTEAEMYKEECERLKALLDAATTHHARHRAGSVHSVQQHLDDANIKQ